jgi:hypothetical protein
MHLLIVGLLLVLSAAYLLHQFLTRDLAREDEPAAADPAAASLEPPSQLRAA